ncbi:MAG: family 10 glycosylhydrolase [Calditrichaeota bacterium]|nr:family 10 glycosylhydrolase [Calditrichota bacterium]MCB0269083.1 family 10 glycosylhydrolase [Calditrichota bacterium]
MLKALWQMINSVKFWLVISGIIHFSVFANADVEVRALWVIRHQMKTPQSIDSVLKFAAANQITDLFVQVRGRGDAYYHSRFEPKAEEIPENFDPLGYLLIKANRKKIRIHAWVNMFYIWSSEKKPVSPEHLINRKPEWLIYPSKYDPALPDSNWNGRRNEEGLYLAPLIEDVQIHLLNVVDDILSQYELDGLHLDYIRFPGYGFDFDPYVRDKFKERYVIDPAEFRNTPESFSANYGAVGYDIFFSRWGKFLRDGLSEFIEKLAKQTRERHPEVIISAAVKPDLRRAHWYYYQDWDRWLNEGWLDWAVPMNYAKSQSDFEMRMDQMLEKVPAEKVVMGTALYNQPWSSVKQKWQTIQNKRDKNEALKGVALFSYDQISESGALQKAYTEVFIHRRTR